MEKNIVELKEALENSRPEKWEQIPDIDLYMDQVISYMERQHIGFELDEEENLTSAMINNYIKSGIMPRANGKRYNREHIGYLTAICLLKQILSVKDAGVLLEEEVAEGRIEEFYESYIGKVDRELSEVASKLTENMSREELGHLAMELAISSYAEKLVCKKIVENLKEEAE